MKQKAGVVAYRPVVGAEPVVLLVSSRKFEGSWVFPVGSVEKGETTEAAARRECLEESGYRVAVGLQLPVLHVANGKTKIRFTFFLASVVGESERWETDRQRKWVPLSELAEALPDVFREVALEAAKSLHQVIDKG